MTIQTEHFEFLIKKLVDFKVFQTENAKNIFQTEFKFYDFRLGKCSYYFRPFKSIF